jgi:hypothetical protein
MNFVNLGHPAKEAVLQFARSPLSISASLSISHNARVMRGYEFLKLKKPMIARQVA